MRMQVQTALDDETQILFWPGGDINLRCLDDLLRTAHEERLPSSHKLSYLRHERVQGFYEDSPEWVNKEEARTVVN